MKPVAAVVAILVVLLTGPPAGPFSAVADAAPAPAAARGPLQLDLADMAPHVVTADGPDTLTITGTLTNTSAAPIDKLVIRVQRGDPLETEGELRDALEGNGNTDSITPDFLPLTGELLPGADIPVRLSVPLRGDPTLGLALTTTGVHEILVNINGTPRDGDRARLAAIRLLLPVLSLPPDPSVSSGRPVTPAAGAATPFTLLYPVTDTPRRLSTVAKDGVLLSDDTLAASFAPTGRLGGLVAAFAEHAPAGSRIRSATCLAVDPDLVDTATAMRGGYQVLGPDGRTSPGGGADAAGSWVDQLAAIARTGCVIALPYADADLVALTRGGLGDTAAAAITDGRVLLAQELQTGVLPSVTWPADEVADEPTLDGIAGTGSTAVVLSATGLDQGRVRRNSGVMPVAGLRTPLTAVLADPLLTLAATGPRPVTPTVGIGAAAPSSSPAGSAGPLSTQDLLGSLAFRVADGPPAAGPLLLAPPHVWPAGGAAAGALLKSVGQLIDAGRLTPRPLADVLTVGSPPGTGPRPATYPISAGGQEIPAATIAAIRTSAEDLTDLRSAAVAGSGVGLPVDDVLAPWERGIVRPASAALRGSPDAARAAASVSAKRIRDLRATVRVLEPPSPYALGTSDAPLPLTVANGLPFTIEVRIELQSSSGLRMAAVPPLQIPPEGRRQVSANAKVTRAGQFTVDAYVRSPDGGLLGPPSRLSVQSTAYGTITLWLTGSAGVLLVLLAGRRVLRRIRGEPGRHSEAAGRTGRPDPTTPATSARTGLPRAPGNGHPSGSLPNSPVPRRTGDPFPSPVSRRGSSHRDHHQAPAVDESEPRARVGTTAGGAPDMEDLAATDRLPAMPPTRPRPEPPQPGPRTAAPRP